MKETTGPRWASVWGFFGATYALSWLIWLPAIVWRGEAPNLLLVVLGAFVPSLMGILFTYLTRDRAGRRDFWRRVVDVRRIGWRWWIVIILLFPVVHGIAIPLYALLGGTPPALGPVGEALADPALVLQLVMANLLISGFSEELGWRGFALDRLQGRWRALRASLILGLVHGLWHLPLFFIPGITQGEMGLLSPGALVFLAGSVAGGVIFTWVYNNTQRSILSAVLLHFMINLCLDLLVGLQGALPTGYSAVYAGVLIL
ncbi:MAG: type II CAAX endopeptidase family protein, partial [Anaerolineae bacterium]